MTKADSVKIRREIYGLGREGVQRTVVLFNGRNSILWMELVRPGKSGDLYLCELLVSLPDSSAS